ncbi:hypothetical protein ALC57_06243 [Trachymyrmex cornetzi]|uniref:Uncharacterized protein n=1 Tax=Trachymyrmex cornetzi TaxID=471704 RepID=A0A195E7Y3_9HYME|nr:hypothetical protein ALC57_06243 [Trachymyrmex cornetzi]
MYNILIFITKHFVYLELRINFPPFDRTLEYNYNLRKNITVFRDPLQTTLYTGSVTCQTEATTNNSLLCLLHYIDVYSSLTFETLNTTNEVTYEKYYPDDWFAKYIHAIEILDDKLNISTTMDVRLPADPWNPKGTLVFRETTQLDLISITSRTKVFHSYMRDNYRWIDLME